MCAWSNKPETLIGDRAYDSDPLDDDLRKDGIEMVAPHRSNRHKCATQDSLASCWISKLLAVEMSEKGRAAKDRSRAARIDPTHEHGKFALGCLTPKIGILGRLKLDLDRT